MVCLTKFQKPLVVSRINSHILDRNVICPFKFVSNTEQIHQVQKPPTLRLQAKDKPHGGYDRGRNKKSKGTIERY